jgi:hypothetical protein
VFPRRRCRPGYAKVSPPKGSGVFFAPRRAALSPRVSRFSILSSRWGSFSPRRAPSGKGDRKRLAIDLMVVSQLLAGTRSGPGRSPGAARVPDPRDQTRGRRAPSRLTRAEANRGGRAVPSFGGRRPDPRTPREAPFSGRSGAMILGRGEAGIIFWCGWQKVLDLRPKQPSVPLLFRAADGQTIQSQGGCGKGFAQLFGLA